MIRMKDLARYFNVLSVDTRVRIIRLLKDGPLCVMVIASRLNITQGAISQHLRILRDAGIVSAEKRGYYMHYRINRNTLKRWAGTTERFFSEILEASEGKESHKCLKKKTCAKNRRS